MTKCKRNWEKRYFFLSSRTMAWGPWLSAALGEHVSKWPLEGLGYFRNSLMRVVVSSNVAVATVLRKVLNALDITRQPDWKSKVLLTCKNPKLIGDRMGKCEANEPLVNDCVPPNPYAEALIPHVRRLRAGALMRYFSRGCEDGVPMVGFVVLKEETRNPPLSMRALTKERPCRTQPVRGLPPRTWPCWPLTSDLRASLVLVRHSSRSELKHEPGGAFLPPECSQRRGTRICGTPS